MGNYNSAVVTVTAGGEDPLPEGETRVFEARVTTPPAWRRRPTAHNRCHSAPGPLAPIDEEVAAEEVAAEEPAVEPTPVEGLLPPEEDGLDAQRERRQTAERAEGALPSGRLFVVKGTGVERPDGECSEDPEGSGVRLRRARHRVTDVSVNGHLSEEQAAVCDFFDETLHSCSRLSSCDSPMERPDGGWSSVDPPEVRRRRSCPPLGHADPSDRGAASADLAPVGLGGDVPPDDSEGGPTRVDLTELVLRRSRPAEAARAEAALIDSRLEHCKERCIDHYLELVCGAGPHARPEAEHFRWHARATADRLARPAQSGRALLAMDQSRLVEACLSLQSSHQALRQRGRGLRSQVAGLSGAGDALEAQTSQLRVKLKASEAEVALTKEALAALKADRKRLKAEKFDLLNQMKQLYQTLEDKERELRDFIRNYEQRIKENDESLRTLAAERDETEREKWNILKHARDETERSVGLSAELSNKDGQLKHITEELTGLRKQLSQLGYYSDQEAASRPSRAAAPPPAAAPALAPAPPSLSPGALGTPNGRGSSADSGVRVSSDRDSVAAGTSGNLSDSTTSGEAGAPAHNPDGVPTDYDSISIVSSVTACSPYYYYAPADGQRGSPTMSPLTLSHTVDVASISKSAEQLDSLDQLDRKLRPKGAKQGTWGSISRVFSRQKQRKQLHMGAHTNDETWSPHSSLCSSPLTDESYAEKLRLLEEAQQLPMERWKASMVLAWLQVTLGMPQYGPACAENVRSGKVMLELTDVDLERGLGILQPMHKKKLRLAIEELRQPHLCKYPYISQLNHGWVAAEWLPDVGLAQYSDIFSAHLMDGRMLAHLTKKDMEKYLNVTRKFHQVSMLHGIQLLRLLQFDRQIICERRQRSELNGDDVLVWTNARFVHWARSIDLAEYADNLKDSGVHGALVTLELSFTADTMATALGVPQSKSMIRRHLAAELDKLVRPARVLLDEEARYARWEQERRRADRPAAATLGRPFSRSYASGLQRSSDKDKRGSSLRNMQLQFMHKKGSLSRAFGLKTRQELQQREPVYETPRASAARAAPPPPPPLERPQSVVTTSSESRVERQHRRIKSISDMETITVTPV
ncbi:kazrin-like isoform X7 [Pollicipes pollicipes]|uniref:kazrin-like isoform X7 n=1 Tax=Pollicipes pollicipes TaxID=41117 RepID=UPI001885755A|nr:kazrin-like isoform X7 [Pollicipes pollicipes]